MHVVVPLGSLWSSPLGQISAMPLQRASPLGSRASTVFCSSRALFIIRMETGLRRYLLCPSSACSGASRSRPSRCRAPTSPAAAAAAAARPVRSPPAPLWQLPVERRRGDASVAPSSCRQSLLFYFGGEGGGRRPPYGFPLPAAGFGGMTPYGNSLPGGGGAAVGPPRGGTGPMLPAAGGETVTWTVLQ